MILAIAILAEASSASAGNGLFFLKRVGTFIDTMSVSGVDRRYIDAPEKPWQLILRGNVNQSSVKMSTESRIRLYFHIIDTIHLPINLNLSYKDIVIWKKMTIFAS